MDYNTYWSQGSTTAFCLGHPSHAMQPGVIICHICGALAGGTLLGAYRVQHMLGAGRSGYAYLAVHQRSGQPVVIKLFPPDNTTMPLWEAARRDVRVATALRHPSIIAVYSCTSWNPSTNNMSTSGTLHIQSDQQQNYLLTLCQYIPGNFNHFVAYYQQPEKQQELKERGSSLQQLLIKVIQQAGSALSTAHRRGIAHGALTPGNLLFNAQEQVWLADVGLARLHPPVAPYLPPELYRTSQASIQMGNASTYWHTANPASDQYMFAMLCQQLFAQLLPQHDYKRFQPVLQHALQHKPERRYPTIDLLVADLVTLAQGGTGPLQPISQAGNSHNPSTPLPIVVEGPLTPSTPATPLTPAPTLEQENWEKRGDKLFTMREYEGALQAYHRALEVNWNKDNIWMALGDTYFALERHKEALMAYEQAMQLNPNDPQTWINRGTALDTLGRHREAEDCYDRAEQLRTV
jgi:serine/threonine protein kinase